MAEAGDIITRVYSGFRGVDFRGDEISLYRSPDSLNIWKDYNETDSIRTRPGVESFLPTDEPVYGLFTYKDYMLAHCGSKLYKIAYGYTIQIYSKMNNAVSNSFIFNDILYIKDGKNYLQFDGRNVTEVVGFIPTTSIARSPAGGGEMYQDINYLSGYRYNTFLADGVSKEFALDAQNIDSSFVPEVTVNDEVEHGFKVDYATGKITFFTAPPAPKTDGQDNVKIKFLKNVVGYPERIKKCTLLQVFDNRVFFSGNPDYPNMVFHCSLDDPSYCSDLDYYNEGMDKAAVRGMVAGNNALWVFREPSHANTTVFYHTPTIDSDYGKIYPSTHSNVTTGCIGKAINFNDDIVFFSDRGMEGISGDVTTEQVISHRSSMVDRKLTAEENYKDMVLAEWKGYLVVFVGTKVYLADSRSKFTHNGSTEYDWWYWDIGHQVNCALVDNGNLYIGTGGGIYLFNENISDGESYWITPIDKFKHANRQKTTNKKGCVVEATGDFSVYAKTDSSEFNLIGEYTNVTDYCVCRVKLKKFKDLQLKFHSNTKFSLEMATIEAFLGGYIKR